MTDITERFPVCIGFGSTRRPIYRTTTIKAASGWREANAEWAYPLHEFDISTGVKTDTDMETFMRFFHATAGGAYTFPFEDRLDYKSCPLQSTPASSDQTLATAVASQTEVQLIKNYTATGRTQARKIVLPRSGTLLVEVDAVAQTEGVDFNANYSTGLLTFTSPFSGGEVIKAGFEFDLVAYFGKDVFDFVIPNKTDGDIFYVNGSCTVYEDRV